MYLIEMHAPVWRATSDLLELLLRLRLAEDGQEIWR